MASGEMSTDSFTQFLTTVFSHLAAHSVDGAIHFQCMDWRHIAEVSAAGRAAYSELKNLCVWAKTGAGMGSFYRSHHELVFVFKSGSGAHINNIELGRHGRNRSSLWTYAGENGLGAGRDSFALHPTVKPILATEVAGNRRSAISPAPCGARRKPETPFPQAGRRHPDVSRWRSSSPKGRALS